MALIKLKKTASTDTEITARNDKQGLLVSEFILCQNFVFRLRDIDCYWHAAQAEGPSITAVYLKGYSPHVVDRDGKLFRFLCETLSPQCVDE